MASSILWQNDTGGIVLIDVPQSIAQAQGTSGHPCHDKLLSVEPLSTPFPTNEPKHTSSKIKTHVDTEHEDRHKQYADLLEHALAEVAAHHSGDWCLPRTFLEQNSLKRKHESEIETCPADSLSKLRSLVSSSSLPEDSSTQGQSIKGHDPGEEKHVTTSSELLIGTTDELLVVNSAPEPGLRVMEKSHAPSYTYRMPPQSTFYQGDCYNSQAFRAEIRDQAQQADSRRKFDFILLDPPWPNRSVKRTHKTPGSTYYVMPSLHDVEHLLTGIDLDMLMADDCLVGVWITNKPAILDLVVGESGLFDSWGVVLCAEWIWLKVTRHGEPVTSIHATWRKPYEILLLGRKRSPMSSHRPTVSAKVIIGVPDVHSRKPCIKELIEPLLPPAEQYRVLEVFARHLVAGWWSWGNECTKLNELAYWRSSVQAQDTCFR